MSEVSTWFWAARSARCANACGSDSGAPTASGWSERIEGGSAASTTSSSDANPTAANMVATAAGSGPMWRPAKVLGPSSPSRFSDTAANSFGRDVGTVVEAVAGERAEEPVLVQPVTDLIAVGEPRDMIHHAVLADGSDL